MSSTTHVAQWALREVGQRERVFEPFEIGQRQELVDLLLVALRLLGPLLRLWRDDSVHLRHCGREGLHGRGIVSTGKQRQHRYARTSAAVALSPPRDRMEVSVVVDHTAHHARRRDGSIDEVRIELTEMGDSRPGVGPSVHDDRSVARFGSEIFLDACDIEMLDERGCVGQRLMVGEELELIRRPVDAWSELAAERMARSLQASGSVRRLAELSRQLT